MPNTFYSEETTVSEKLKICTFNLRIDTPHDGMNRFVNRTGRVLDVLTREKPDLIGFQEANGMMRAWLTDNLREYTVLGCGRMSDCTGESAAIAVKRDRFAILSVDNFWLSYTPRVPGSTFGGDQSVCPRVSTCARLRILGTDSYVNFCNTHLDHKGETARLLGAAALLQYLTPTEDHFILTGDFNATPDSKVISEIKGQLHRGRPIVDATEAVPATFHAYGTKKPETKIDYVFTDAEAVTDEAYAICEPPIDGLYVSDHHPVVAYVRI